jgi:hypothetical protein
MKRTQNQAYDDLRYHLESWLRGGARPGIHVFVYPPEWEADMLARFPSFVQECQAFGVPLDIDDVGQGFLAEVERRKGFVERLTATERESEERVIRDLGTIAVNYLTRLIRTPAATPGGARLLANTGALATLVSYSAIANALHGDGPEPLVGAPTILTFPGEGDDRSLNLMRLRTDTNYRLPRV